MFRQAFSMIELVFVIVILGILSAVAIPRFASIADDALIATEKTTIGVARQGVTALYGKRLIRGKDMSVLLVNNQGTEYYCDVNFSSTYYPLSVTTTKDNNVTGNPNNVVISSSIKGDRKALAIVVEPESLADWNSTAIIDDEIVQYVGSASSAVKDTEAEIHQGNYWEYSNVTGRFILKSF